MTARESDLREQVRALAQLYGWRMYFTYRSTRSPAGFPDLVLVKAPRLIFAELKSAIGRPSPDQKLWLAALDEVPGLEVYLWRPEDLERIVDILSGLTDQAPATCARCGRQLWNEDSEADEVRFHGKPLQKVARPA